MGQCVLVVHAGQHGRSPLQSLGCDKAFRINLLNEDGVTQRAALLANGLLWIYVRFWIAHICSSFRWAVRAQPLLR